MVAPDDDDIRDAMVVKAERRDRLIRILEKLAEYNPDNCEKAEFVGVQKRIQAIVAELEALTPTALVKLPTLREVLNSIIGELHRFFVMPEHDAQIIALWIVHTHVFLHEIFEFTPRLIVWSKTHGSGKSTLRDFITRLSPNVEAIDTLRGGELIAFLRRRAAMRNDNFLIQYFREKGLLGLGLHTYLFDEAEQYEYTGLLMRLLNSGYRHDGAAWASDGSKVPLFAPVALFRRHDPRKIRELAPTVSRSVLIEMKQKASGQKREEFRSRNRYVRRLTVLNQQIAGLVQNMRDNFTDWRPEPEFLAGNRNADNWEPLVAIADLAGGHWGQTARKLCSEYTEVIIQDDGDNDDTRSPAEPASGRSDIIRPPRHALRSFDEHVSGAKKKIMDYLINNDIRRCGLTQLHEQVFSSNTKAAVKTQAIKELETEEKIKTSTAPPGPMGGRWTTMIELVLDGGGAAAPDKPGRAEPPIVPVQGPTKLRRPKSRAKEKA